MARKRVVKKKVKTVVEVPAKVKPLRDSEGQLFQELVNSSNAYTNLLAQKAKYEFIVKKLKDDRKKIQTGEIPLPMTMTLIPNLLAYPENDKKVVLKLFDDQIASYNKNLITLAGQIEHRYEDYLESAIRNREFMIARYKNLQPKKIVPLRKVGEKQEEVLFEAEFAELVKSEAKQEELKEATKEAVKRNISRKQKA